MFSNTKVKSDYAHALKVDTVEEYNEFLSKYESQSFEMRQQYREINFHKAKAMYKRALKENTFESYADFLSAYSEGKDLIFNSRKEYDKVRKRLTDAEKRATKIYQTEVKAGERKPKTWQDYHMLLNSNFHDDSISNPPLEVKPYIYTWNGKLTADFGEFYIFRNKLGLYALEKKNLRTKSELSMNTWFITIGAHAKNTKVQLVLGNTALIPVLSVPLIFDYESDYQQKLF